MVPDGSPLVGKSIDESGLRERDVVVLTLNRGAHVISNPKHSRVIEPGDRLLCYGRLESMRDLVPTRRKRRRRFPIHKLDPQLLDELDNADGGHS